MFHSRMSTSESDWPKMHETNFTTDLSKCLKGLQSVVTKIYKTGELTFISRVFAIQVNNKTRMKY